jgi:hypothetical protein
MKLITDSELSRYEFFEAIIALAKLRFCNQQKGKPETSWRQSAGGTSAKVELTVAQAYEKMCAEVIAPNSPTKTNDQFKKGMSDPSVQALFGRVHKDLHSIYNHYAAALDSKPTMNLEEFTKLMVDAALIGIGTKSGKAATKVKVGALREKMKKKALAKKILDESAEGSGITKTDRLQELTPQEARIAFALAQRDDEDDLEQGRELVFCEFLEAVARIALFKWEFPLMPFRDKIGMALEAIVGVKELINIEQGRVKKTPNAPAVAKPQKPGRISNHRHARRLSVAAQFNEQMQSQMENGSPAKHTSTIGGAVYGSEKVRGDVNVTADGTGKR